MARSPRFSSVVRAFLCGAALVAVAAPGRGEAPKTIYIGGLFSITSPARSVSLPYSEGIIDYLDYVNDHLGGVNKRKISFFWEDYAYQIPRALEVYKHILAKGRPLAIFGNGTGDTLALIPKVTADRIPFMSLSYASNLSDGRKTPFNFFVGTAYDDQYVVALRYAERLWKERRRPRVGFVYPDNPYGRLPSEFGRTYAKKLGFEVLPDQILPFDALNGDAQAQALGDGKADFVFIVGIANSTVAFVKSARKIGFNPTMICVGQSLDENIVKNLGDAGDGIYSVMSTALWQDREVPGVAVARKIRLYKHKDREPQPVYYIQGLTSAMVMIEAIRRVGDNLTPEAVKDALEHMTDFSTEGLAPPVTFSPDRHNGNIQSRVRQFQAGKLNAISDYITAVK